MLDPIDVLGLKVILPHVILEVVHLSIPELDLACLGVTVMLLLSLLDGELHPISVIFVVSLLEEASKIGGSRVGHNFINMRRWHEGDNKCVSLNRWYQSSYHFLAFLEMILLFLI